MQTRFLILQIADFGLFSRAFVLPKYEKTKKANSCKKVYFLVTAFLLYCEHNNNTSCPNFQYSKQIFLFFSHKTLVIKNFARKYTFLQICKSSECFCQAEDLSAALQTTLRSQPTDISFLE